MPDPAHGDERGGWATWSDDAEAVSKRGRCYPPELLAQAWAYLVRRLDA